MNPVEEIATLRMRLFILCLLLFLFLPVLYLSTQAFSFFLLQGMGMKGDGHIERATIGADFPPQASKILRGAADLLSCRDVRFEDREKKTRRFFACFFTAKGHSPGDRISVLYAEDAPEFAVAEDDMLAIQNLMGAIFFLYGGIAVYRWRK